MMRPVKPSKAPHTERLRSRMAGLRRMALPSTFGTTMESEMTCTTQNTNTTMPKMAQKLSPVSVALSIERKAAGIRAKP